ncbi:MAG: YidC/Oxa1 family membrane protein insertase [Candidatus Kerfeldbacteria bacterium]
MIEFLYTVLYEPLFNFLVWIYDVLPYKDLGVAIILLTLVVKLVLFYPSLKGLRSQKSLQDAQPKIEEIKKKYADDKEEMGRQIMAFYKENKVNPMSSCLPLLIQLPILWALFRVFLIFKNENLVDGLLPAEQIARLYGPLAEKYADVVINKSFLGFVDLGMEHNIVLAVLAGIVTFASAKMLSSKRAAVQSKGAKDENMAAAINKQMVYFMPIITVVFGYTFPAGVTLYWLCSSTFQWGQQLIFLREKKKMEGEDGGQKQTVESTAKEKERKSEEKK